MYIKGKNKRRELFEKVGVFGSMYGLNWIKFG